MHINDVPFNGQDLNLLFVFMIIFRERSVTKTAQQLKVTQPAVSGTLLKLRRRFEDPLFTRVRGRMEPTEKATKIAHALLPAMAQLEKLLVEGPDAASEGISLE